MSGAVLSGRLAGKVTPRKQIQYGFTVMLLVAVVNLILHSLFAPSVTWALFPIAVFAFGWSLMVPVVTLLVLDLHPERRGMASSLQSAIGAAANGLVAGVLAPLVMHSTVLLAAGSLGLMLIGLCAWIFVIKRWPATGREKAI